VPFVPIEPDALVTGVALPRTAPPRMRKRVGFDGSSKARTWNVDVVPAKI